MTQPSLAIPDALVPFAGQMLDVDTHESLPVNLWEERYGSVVNDFAEALRVAGLPAGVDTKERDDTDINADTVWKKKRLDAPGSFDFKRRLEVLDLTGIKKQLVFPGAMGLMSVSFHANAGNPNVFKALSGSAADRRGYAMKLMHAYNSWCTRVTKGSDRYVAVAILVGDTVDEITADAKRLVNEGVRGLWMPSSTPPGGFSPAHSVFDPLWDILSAGDVPLLSHVGADMGFLKTEAWRDAPAFEGYRLGDEFSLDPWTLSTNHRATENFLTTMIVGGVFDRHPKLRYGAMESGGNWIGPLGEHLDLWIENSGVFVGPTAKKPHFKLRPSEYIRRNVRVAPFGFEDVGHYIALYGMPEVYCYQSDFPHLEGGRDPMGETVKSFARQGMGEDIMRQFFVENGKFLMPN